MWPDPRLSWRMLLGDALEIRDTTDQDESAAGRASGEL